jgi:hypothetical protein
MHQGEGCVCRRNIATDLGHHAHERNRTNVSTFPAHVASGYDLKSRLLASINIIWNELLRMYLMKNMLGPNV